MKSMNQNDKFYPSYECGYDGVMRLKEEYTKVFNNVEFPVFILTHPDMKRDRIMARELGALDAINALITNHFPAHATHRVPIYSGTAFDLAKWSNKCPYFGHHHEFYHVLPRYGFIFNPIRLHDLEGFCLANHLYTTIRYNDYTYWRFALWEQDLKDTDLYPKTSREGTIGLSKSEKGWFIRNYLKSYKRWHQPLKTQEELTSAINSCLDAGSFNGDSGWFAVEWMDIALACDVHPELHADKLTPAEYRCHVALGKHGSESELFHSHLYDDTYADIVVPDDVKEFALKVAERLGYSGTLVAIDIARLTDSSLKCIEVNCGESSGMLYPELYYLNMLK